MQVVSPRNPKSWSDREDRTSPSLCTSPITDIRTLSLLGMILTITALSIGEFSQDNKNRVLTRSFLNGLDSLLAFISSTLLVPKLTDLKLVVHPKDLASDAFLKMLSSRWLPEPYQATEVGAECLRFVKIAVVLSEGVD